MNICSKCKMPPIDGCREGLIPRNRDGTICEKYFHRDHSESCPNLLIACGIYSRAGKRDEYAERYPFHQLFSGAKLDVNSPIVMSDRQLQKAYRAAISYKTHLLKGEKPKGLSFSIFGQYGRGKTYLAAALANEMRAAGWRVIFKTEMEL